MRIALIIFSFLLVPVAGANPPLASDSSSRDRIRVQLGAAQEASLASQMEGRIVALPKKLGDTFRKGDLLVAFACDHHKAALAAAAAQVVRAEKSLQSRESLLQLQAVSELDVELAKAESAQAAAELSRQQAIVSDCRVLAPFPGKVVRVMVNQWETVSRGTVLIHIVNPQTLEIEAVVPSLWLRWLKVGTRFAVSVDELGRDVEAEVVAIGGRIDPVSQSVPVKARITSATDGLLPGMSGYARFEPSDG